MTVAAGSAALPTLLKLASVKAVQPAVGLAGGGGGGGGNGGGSGAGAAAAGAGAGEPGEEEQLPVEIPLGREFVFHSIFACPVSREQVRRLGWPRGHLASVGDRGGPDGVRGAG